MEGLVEALYRLTGWHDQAMFACMLCLVLGSYVVGILAYLRNGRAAQ